MSTAQSCWIHAVERYPLGSIPENGASPHEVTLLVRHDASGLSELRQPLEHSTVAPHWRFARSSRTSRSVTTFIAFRGLTLFGGHCVAGSAEAERYALGCPYRAEHLLTSRVGASIVARRIRPSHDRDPSYEIPSLSGLARSGSANIWCLRAWYERSRGFSAIAGVCCGPELCLFHSIERGL